MEFGWNLGIKITTESCKARWEYMLGNTAVLKTGNLSSC